MELSIHNRPAIACCTRSTSCAEPPAQCCASQRDSDVVLCGRDGLRTLDEGGERRQRVSTGSAPDGNTLPIRKQDAEIAMDAAACIGCGACVASCPNASAALFTSAKISHLAHLPQGQPERYERSLAMVRQMNAEGFGNCTNIGECEATCPKSITLENIALMNTDFLRASWSERPSAGITGAG